MDEHQLRRIRLYSPSDVREIRAHPVRLRHGVYADRGDLPSREREAMHFIRMDAARRRVSRDLVFSHRSAAIVWGIPVVGSLAPTVDAIAWRRNGVRSQRGITWHNDHIDEHDVVEVDGVWVTSVGRTLFDLARTLPFASAVASLDHGAKAQFITPFGTATRGATRAELAERLEGSAGRRGIRAARQAIAFCDPASGSAGESISRAHMHTMGFPPPLLQVGFPRLDGFADDIVDFDWPDLGRFGEFDGRGKYEREEYTGGRTQAEVLWKEKLREDRIRRHRPVGARWDWAVAIRPARLAHRLIEFGIYPTERGV